jgi:hypothetical protein
MAAELRAHKVLSRTRPTLEVPEMNGFSTRLAASIIADRHAEAAQIRATRTARRSMPWPSALERLLSFAEPGRRRTSGPARTAQLHRGGASSD